MLRAVRYRLLSKIAHGGMAEIFLAVQGGAEGFEKQVVLKRILPALAADPAFVRMLVDEAHIASTLNHSNLVQVLDLGQSGDEYFLVLEFVDGWSLEQVRRRAQKARMKLPLPLALYVVGALCRALAYVHTRKRNGRALGIVHRDVTPQNVLLSREGEVKLADFGIAKAVGKREKSATGVIKGKFAYMSPEQTMGGDLDARSDLFSVGTLLYILTTGRKPFEGTTDLDVLMQVRKARYEKPSNLVRDFNPDVERFIIRALRADRARRWQNAEQMADRIDAILVKLALPSGAAALKRWLESLGAKDGVKPPAEMSDATADPGTIELVSGDLEPGDDLELHDVPSPRSADPRNLAAASEVLDAALRTLTAADAYEELSASDDDPQPAPTSPTSASTGADHEERSFTAAEVRSPAPPLMTITYAEEDPSIELELRSPSPAPTTIAEVIADDLPSEVRITESEEISAGDGRDGGEDSDAGDDGDTDGDDSDDDSDDSAVDHGTPTRSAPPAPALLDAEAEFAVSAPTLVAPGAGRPWRAAIGAVVVLALVLVGGGAYFVRPYLPSWLVDPVKAWLHRLQVPSSQDLTGDPRVPETVTQ